MVRLLYWIVALDPALTWDQRVARWADISTIASPVVTVLAGLFTHLVYSNAWIGVIAGLILWNLLLSGFVALRRLHSSTSSETPVEAESGSAAPQPSPAAADSRQAQEVEIELGDTARLFLMKGARCIPEGNSERRTVFFPALLEHWVGPFSSAVEAGRTFVAHEIVFENCDIYGPVVFVLAEGSVEDTFHKCDWEEEWRAFWPATKRGRYVGVIALKNCTFRRCNFAGVAVVVKPDEYKRVYRRFTGEDLTD
jgi:hypothetical protein